LLSITLLIIGWVLTLGSPTYCAAFLFMVCVTRKPEWAIRVSGFELYKKKFIVPSILFVIGIISFISAFFVGR